MSRHATIRLVFPQWQGGANPDYAFGAELLALIVPPSSNAKTIEIPCSRDFDERDEPDAEIAGTRGLLTQAEVARIVLDMHTPDRTIELPSELLSRMVDKVYKVTSRETSRPILQGILLTVEDNTIRLVATDSFRLAVCDSSVEAAAGETFRAIVGGAVFHDVLTMPSMTDTIQIGTTESQVVFTFGNTTFVARRIEGNFPDYKQLLPPSCGTAVTLATDEFSAALKRVSVIALQNASVRFDIDVEAGLMKLSASSPEQGESTELLPVEAEGQSLAIALNYHYVFDCVNAVSGAGELRLELQGPTQPGIFKSNGKVNYLYLLMPVRL